MSEDARVEKFKGAAMMAIGALLAGLCGACTLTFLSVSATSALHGYLGEAMSIAILPLVLGGLPTLLGVLLFRAGLRRYRGAPARKPAPEEFD